MITHEEEVRVVTVVKASAIFNIVNWHRLSKCAFVSNFMETYLYFFLSKVKTIYFLENKVHVKS